MFDEEGDILLSQVTEDFDDMEDFNLDKTQEKSRFGQPVTEQFLHALQQGRVPKNTRRNTLWCINVFDKWAVSRNNRINEVGTKTSEKYLFVPPLSMEITADALDFWLCRFVCEVRRQDATNYPALSLKNLCIGIWRYLRDDCKRLDLNIVDVTNPNFVNFRATLDAVMKKLNSQGIGITAMQAQPVTPIEEMKLWESGTFSLESSKGLFNAVYFYNCKVFGLRAADEHSDLQMSQFSFGKDTVGEFVRFCGRNAKNNQGGLKQTGKIVFKDIKQYAQAENPHCVVGMLRLYLDALPGDGPFYRRPLVSTPEAKLRYSQQKVGIHTLQKMFKNMCAEAGIEGRFTGHSGKVTLATTLYNEKVDEQLIMERTGHRSNAVRAYKRTSNALQKDISDKLQPPCKTSASSTVSSLTATPATVSSLATATPATVSSLATATAATPATVSSLATATAATPATVSSLATATPATVSSLATATAATPATVSSLATATAATPATVSSLATATPATVSSLATATAATPATVSSLATVTATPVTVLATATVSSLATATLDASRIRFTYKKPDGSSVELSFI